MTLYSAHNSKCMYMYFTFHIMYYYSRGAVRSAASSYAAMRMVAGSRPALVIA